MLNDMPGYYFHKGKKYLGILVKNVSKFLLKKKIYRLPGMIFELVSIMPVEKEKIRLGNKPVNYYHSSAFKLSIIELALVSSFFVTYSIKANECKCCT